MSTTAVHPYVTRKEGIQGGQPVITGTRTPVRSIVFYHKLGEVPEEIAEKLPHLTLAQIYDALSYYYDHREEIDRDIEANTEEAVKREFGL
jgi:uncharacterized protein (DUF433 family)